jgi:DNA gyrase subunit A
LATLHAHQLVCDLGEINLLANPGRGVTVVKLDGDDDRVVGFSVDEPLAVESEKGKRADIAPLKRHRAPRGGKGAVIWTRKDRVAKVVTAEVTVPQLASGDKDAGELKLDGDKR